MKHFRLIVFCVSCVIFPVFLSGAITQADGVFEKEHKDADVVTLEPRKGNPNIFDEKIHVTSNSQSTGFFYRLVITKRGTLMISGSCFTETPYNTKYVLATVELMDRNGKQLAGADNSDTKLIDRKYVREPYIKGGSPCEVSPGEVYFIRIWLDTAGTADIDLTLLTQPDK